MKSTPTQFSQQYRAALIAHLREGRKASIDSARGFGALALAAGLDTLDLAKVHEQILLTEVLPDCPARGRAAVLRQAGRFFATAIIPADTAANNGAEPRRGTNLEGLMGALSQRTIELVAANQELSREIAQRKAFEKELRAKERSHASSLEKSARLQQQLRRLSRQLLSAQEDERKKISRELHDVIGQTLAGINIHLATLKREAALNTGTLIRNIERTQRLVEKSADLVNHFARELRPAVLDDLGLIPALHSFMETFTSRTGIRAELTASAAVAKLNSSRRTALFRVAQEALTNVARHADATRVAVTIRKLPSEICMDIGDDGKSFDVASALTGRGRRRLGLLGMRERMEMIGGRLQVESSPGHGTTVTATIPLRAERTLPGGAGDAS